VSKTGWNVHIVPGEVFRERQLLETKRQNNRHARLHARIVYSSVNQLCNEYPEATPSAQVV